MIPEERRTADRATLAPSTGSGLAGNLARAVALDVSALIPVGLVGALGVLMVVAGDVPTFAPGVMVGAFFLAGGTLITWLGPAVDRWGWRRSALVGLALTMVSLTCCAGFARPWPLLVLWMGAAGTGSALIQISSSVMLNATTAPGRRGFALSMKFAAVPTALLVSGLTVPLLGTTVGWRPTFALLIVVPAVALVALRLRSSATPGRRAGLASQPAAGVRRGLLVAGVSMFLGSMLCGVLIGFTVVALVDVGLGPSAAGLVFAALNVLSALSRVGVALLADRPAFGDYRVIAAMMLLGGLGAALLGDGRTWSVLVGGAVAFVFGWGWTGQAFFLAVRSFPENPAAAASVIQSGGMFGSAVGPLAGAVAVHAWGLSAAWLVAAAASVLGSVLLLVRPGVPRVRAEAA